MSSFFFVMRTLVLTFVVLLLMQMKWQGRTIEDHAMSIITSSDLIGPLEVSAEATVKYRNDFFIKPSV